MASSRLQVLIDCSYSIVLHAFVVDNELDHAIPYFRTNMVAGSSYKLKDGIDVPLVLFVSSALSVGTVRLVVIHTSVAKRSVKMAIFNTISSLKL